MVDREVNKVLTENLHIFYLLNLNSDKIINEMEFRFFKKEKKITL